MSATCGREMRDDTECSMDEGHRGRCSSVTFVCDACGKARRGQPDVVATNPWDDVVEAQFCWFCQNVDQSRVREEGALA